MTRTPTTFASDSKSKTDFIKLVRAVNRITDAKPCRKLLKVVRAAADTFTQGR